LKLKGGRKGWKIDKFRLKIALASRGSVAAFANQKRRPLLENPSVDNPMPE
jgi:hypothetical protein